MSYGMKTSSNAHVVHDVIFSKVSSEFGRARSAALRGSMGECPDPLVPGRDTLLTTRALARGEKLVVCAIVSAQELSI